jgi:hypothetical protein
VDESASAMIAPPEGAEQYGLIRSLTKMGVGAKPSPGEFGNPLDPRASGQTDRRHAGKNRGGNGAEGPRNSGHGVRFTAEENRPKKNSKKCDNQQDFHESPPDLQTFRAMRESAFGGPKKITAIAWTYGRTCPWGHRKFGRKKVNLAWSMLYPDGRTGSKGCELSEPARKDRSQIVDKILVIPRLNPATEASGGRNWP